jgi:HEAT repeat protein
MSEPLRRFYQAIAAGEDELTEQAVSTLAATDEPALLAQLGQRDREVRWWAIRALAHCGTTAAIPALLNALSDADPSLRAVAALTLGHLYQPERPNAEQVVTHLATHLADDDGSVRQTAADALVHCGDTVVPVLATVLRGDHQGARTRAAYALSKLASMPAAITLYHCLNDSNYMVQTYAYETLDKMGLLENVLVIL